MSWYAAQVRSNFEGMVSQALTERRLDAFYPYIERKDARKRIFRRPYFPGYVFVSADLTTNVERRRIIDVPQVVRIVGTGTEPEAIPECQIFSVRQVAAIASERARVVEVIPTAAYKEGELIEIEAGPLAGVRGYVAFIKNKIRLVVQVGMLGQGISAEVDAEWVRKVRAA